MKRLILVVSMLAIASAASAQSRFYSNIDYPAQQATLRGEVSLVAAGWAFDPATGKHPAFAVPTVFNLDTQAFVVFGTFWMRDHIYRPDVYNAFVGSFPKVTPYEGYHLYIGNIDPATGQLVPVVLPAGHYRIWVNWGFKVESRDITVVNQ